MDNPSRLEIFPDELFLDLFSHIPPTDLYHVWHGLNRRLSAIIRSVSACFDLMENTAENTRALNYFSQQTVYIHFYTSYQSLDLKQFPNLCSLIFAIKPTDEQLNSVQPNILPRLRRLTFSDWWKKEEPLNEIFSNRNFTWLKVVHLPSSPHYFTTNISTQSFIHTLIFDRVTAYDIDLILSIQPQLRRLKVTMVRWMPDKSTTKISNKNANYQHKHLIDLDITMNTCNKLDDLYPFLSRLSGLRYLNIACDTLTMNDFKQLAFELNTCVPWLERLNCSFKQTYIDDMEKLHSMNSLFRRMKCIRINWNGGWYYYCVTTMNVQ